MENHEIRDGSTMEGTGPMSAVSAVLIDEELIEFLVEEVMATDAGNISMPDNVASALTAYFEDISECPGCEVEEYFEFGANPWAVEQARLTAMYIVSSILQGLINKSLGKA